MAQTTLIVRIDAQLKRDFEEFCNNVGMNISVAVNMFAKAVVREQRLPFEVAVDPFYSKTNQERSQRSITQFETTGKAVDLHTWQTNDVNVSGPENSLIDLFGKVRFIDGYNYKLLREGAK